MKNIPLKKVFGKNPTTAFFNKATSFCVIKIPLLLWLLLYGVNLMGQTDRGYIPRVFPVSPEAQALNKFNEWQVGTFHGIPNISIPIWEFEVDGYTLPVSLNYHAGGIKVTEIASNVGLGWALNTGGMISRIILDHDDRNLPLDDIEDDWVDSDAKCYKAQTESNDVYNYITATSTNRNYQPDIYSYSIPGYSGGFFYNEEGEIVPSPATDLKIVEHSASGTEYFKITDLKGTTYYFMAGDTIQNKAYVYGVQSGHFKVAVPREFSVNSFILDYIQLPSGKIIDFEYDKIPYDGPWEWNKYRIGYVNYDFSSLTSDIPNHEDEITIQERVSFNQYQLSKISSDKTEILFEFNGERCDLKRESYLTKITVRDKIKGTSFNYDLDYFYYATGERVEVSEVDCGTLDDDDQYEYRLMLESVRKTGEPPYVFEYYDDQLLPNRLTSYAFDWWGFYNGKHSNSNPLVCWYVPAPDRMQVCDVSKFAANLVYAKANTIEKITYPSGGTSSFVYELHSQPVAGNHGSGYGLRISQIIYDPGDGGNPITKSYSYGSGYASSPPPIYDNTSYHTRGQFAMGMDTNGHFQCPTGSVAFRAWTGIDQYSLGSQGGKVGYSSVTETVTDGVDVSKRTDEYVAGVAYMDKFVYDPVYGFGQTFSEEGNDYPYRQLIDYSWARGLLKSQTYYENNNQVSRTENVWEHFMLPGEPYFEMVKGSKAIAYSRVTNSFLVNDLCTINPSHCLLSAKLDYYISTGLARLVSSATVGNNVSVMTTYEYGENHIQPVRTTTTTSEGKTLVREMKYPPDYVADVNIIELDIENTDYPDIVQLNSKNILAPVYSSSSVKVPGSSELVGLTYTDYDNFGGHYLPARIYQLETAEGLSGSSLTSYAPYNTAHSLGAYGSTKTESWTFDLDADDIAYGEKLNLNITFLCEDGDCPDLYGNVKVTGPGVSYTYHPGTGTYCSDPKPQYCNFQVSISNFQQGTYTVKVSLLDANPNWGGAYAQISLKRYKPVYSVDQYMHEKMAYNYDGDGNLIQYRAKDHDPVAILWGYNNTLPVVKVDGLGYYGISSTHRSTLNNSISDVTIRNTGNTLQSAHPDAMIEIYTYEPLFGVNSATGVDGKTTYFNYDEAGRLIKTTDHNFNLLQEINYHYKNQQ